LESTITEKPSVKLITRPGRPFRIKYDRGSGARPTIQNALPSRLRSGNRNRDVNDERIGADRAEVGEVNQELEPAALK